MTTTTACPAWCELPAGHPAQGHDDATGLFIRSHSRKIPGPYTVWLLADDEILSPDGPTIDKPLDRVDSEWLTEPISAVELDGLIAQLVEARQALAG